MLYESSSLIMADFLQFSFIGPVTHDGRFPVCISFLNLDGIKDSADRTIAQEPDEHEIEFGNPCHEDLGCSQECQTLQNALGRKCIRIQVEDAKKRKQKLASIHLSREFIRNPWSANGMQTLTGMAQDSCIYETQ